MKELIKEIVDQNQKKLKQNQFLVKLIEIVDLVREMIERNQFHVKGMIEKKKEFDDQNHEKLLNVREVLNVFQRVQKEIKEIQHRKKIDVNDQLLHNEKNQFHQNVIRFH